MELLLFLHCASVAAKKSVFLTKNRDIVNDFLKNADSSMLHALLVGNLSFNTNSNSLVLYTAIELILIMGSLRAPTF